MHEVIVIETYETVGQDKRTRRGLREPVKRKTKQVQGHSMRGRERGNEGPRRREGVGRRERPQVEGRQG